MCDLWSVAILIKLEAVGSYQQTKQGMKQGVLDSTTSILITQAVGNILYMDKRTNFNLQSVSCLFAAFLYRIVTLHISLVGIVCVCAWVKVFVCRYVCVCGFSFACVRVINYNSCVGEVVGDMPLMGSILAMKR